MNMTPEEKYIAIQQIKKRAANKINQQTEAEIKRDLTTTVTTLIELVGSEQPDLFTEKDEDKVKRLLLKAGGNLLADFINPFAQKKNEIRKEKFQALIPLITKYTNE